MVMKWWAVWRNWDQHRHVAYLHWLTFINGKNIFSVSQLLVSRAMKLRPTSTLHLTVAHSRSSTEIVMYPLVSFVSVMVMLVSVVVGQTAPRSTLHLTIAHSRSSTERISSPLVSFVSMLVMKLRAVWRNWDQHRHSTSQSLTHANQRKEYFIR